MSEMIKEYYSKADIMPLLLKSKLAKFEKHLDISKEFEYWIKNKSYIQENAISVNGYTAEKLASLSEYLDGEGAFMMLIELKENPSQAMTKIENGFKIK